jgi:hypothetical protein
MLPDEIGNIIPCCTDCGERLIKLLRRKIKNKTKEIQYQTTDTEKSELDAIKFKNNVLGIFIAKENEMLKTNGLTTAVTDIRHSIVGAEARFTQLLSKVEDVVNLTHAAAKVPNKPQNLEEKTTALDQAASLVTCSTPEEVPLIDDLRRSSKRLADKKGYFDASQGFIIDSKVPYYNQVVPYPVRQRPAKVVAPANPAVRGAAPASDDNMSI